MTKTIQTPKAFLTTTDRRGQYDHSSRSEKTKEAMLPRQHSCSHPRTGQRKNKSPNQSTSRKPHHDKPSPPRLKIDRTTTPTIPHPNHGRLSGSIICPTRSQEQTNRTYSSAYYKQPNPIDRVIKAPLYRGLPPWGTPEPAPRRSAGMILERGDATISQMFICRWGLPRRRQ